MKAKFPFQSLCLGILLGAMTAISGCGPISVEIQPTPQQIHFLALQQHCKEQAKKDTAADAYFVCVSRLSI